MSLLKIYQDMMREKMSDIGKNDSLVLSIEVFNGDERIAGFQSGSPPRVGDIIHLDGKDFRVYRIEWVLLGEVVDIVAVYVLPGNGG